jgi:ABC-2 type transport system ATP-binding protein
VTSDPAVVLSVGHARRRYGERAALAGVSIQIATGEVYALIGRNGAGKSTLAKAAIGALSLDSGTVRVLGGDPARDPAARRAIGIAPQEIALYPHMTVAENLDAFATLAGVRTGRREAVAKAMDETACAERARERIDALSGGWRRRANLAAAIVHGPRLLVLDEPTEGLDAETRVVLRRLIDRLRAGGAAILLISHDGEDVAALADRVGVLHAGRVAVEGSLQGLMREAFGERQELAVRLAAASTVGVAILDAHGLSSADEGMTWSGLSEDAPARALEIDHALRAAGASVRELAVRPPGIDALIAWAGEDAAP